jgi:hypothetical protein
MTRKTVSAEDRAIAAAIAKLPFSPEHDADAPERFENLPTRDANGKLPKGARYDVQAGIAAAILWDFKVAGLSGAQLRMRYGGTDDATDGVNVGLSGPRRRRVLRAFGFAEGVARSYDAYSSGEPRKGSAHARMHGTAAEERKAAAAAELAAKLTADAKKAERSAKAKARREAKAAATQAERVAHVEAHGNGSEE